MTDLPFAPDLSVPASDRRYSVVAMDFGMKRMGADPATASGIFLQNLS